MKNTDSSLPIYNALPPIYIDWHWCKTSNKHENIKIHFNVTHLGIDKRTIKYIEFSVKGFNSVKDLVFEDTFKVTGPIKPLKYADYTFNGQDSYKLTLNYKDINSIRVVKFIIIYMENDYCNYEYTEYDIAIMREEAKKREREEEKREREEEAWKRSEEAEKRKRKAEMREKGKIIFFLDHFDEYSYDSDALKNLK